MPIYPPEDMPDGPLEGADAPGVLDDLDALLFAAAPPVDDDDAALDADDAGRLAAWARDALPTGEGDEIVEALVQSPARRALLADINAAVPPHATARMVDAIVSPRWRRAPFVAAVAARWPSPPP